MKFKKDGYICYIYTFSRVSRETIYWIYERDTDKFICFYNIIQLEEHFELLSERRKRVIEEV